MKRVKKANTGHIKTINGKTVLPKAYYCWMSMRNRCYNPKHVSYKDYGANGITVCKRWYDSYVDFIEDMGERPSNHYSVDRKDSKGNYEPSNCKWSTRIEQARNKSNNRMVSYNSETKCVSQWCEDLGLNFNLVRDRILKGETPEKAFSNKLRKTKRLLLNTETGIYYDSMSECSKAHNINTLTLSAWIHGHNKNKSPFISVL